MTDHGHEWLAPAFERRHYTFGFRETHYSGAGQELRDALFDSYATRLSHTFAGLFDMPVREAWVEANELVEDSGVRWAYRRATCQGANTYHERLRAGEPADPESGGEFFTARGTC